MSATPLLDRATIARFTVEDFPLDPSELELMSDPEERYRLEEALRSTVSWEVVAEEGLRRWRERREQ